MKPALQVAFQFELFRAREREAAGALEAAFAHLERAHILSQRDTCAHVGVHLRMLRFGWRRRDAREVSGQFSRTFAALVFSRLWVPIGNTGGANISALRPLPLPEDLRVLLEAE